MGAAVPITAMGMSLLGGYAAGEGARRAGEYEGSVMDTNAVMARRYAADSIARGRVMAGRATSAGTEVISTARASGGASGFSVGSSSMLDALSTTRMMSSLDAETIKSNALREALGYETQAMNFTAQGNLARMKGQNAEVSSLLGGAGSAAQTGYSSGLFPRFGA